MTTRLQILNLPDHTIPIWATNANRTTDPDDTLADAVPIVKEDGWEISQRPPPKVMNWLHHYFSEWLRTAAFVPLSTWTKNVDAGATDIDGICCSPQSGYSWWTIASGTSTYRSESGVDWTASVALNSAANSGAFTISSAYIAIFGTVNGLEYFTGGAYTEVLDAAIGGGFSGGVIAMDTRDPTDDRTIVIDGNGVMRIAASGVAGAWTWPSTPPNLGGTPGAIGRVIWGGGTKWFVCRQATTTSHFAVSDDNGDTWTNKTPVAWASANSEAIAYDPTTGRLVACGTTVGGSSVYYSDDDGDTWTASSFPGIGNTSFMELYSCGMGIWMGARRSTASLAISTDNAETWYSVDKGDIDIGGASRGFLMSDGAKMVAVADSGVTGRSLSYPRF